MWQEMTSHDPRDRSDPEVTSFSCNSQEVAVTWQEMISRDHVPGSSPEVTSFHRKSPWSGCRKPISQVLGTFQLLQFCNSQKVAWQSRGRKWPHETPRDWKSPGSGCRDPINQVLGTFELLQGCNSHEVAVTWQEMTSRDPTWPEGPGSDVISPEVTWKWL